MGFPPSLLLYLGARPQWVREGDRHSDTSLRGREGRRGVDRCGLVLTKVAEATGGMEEERGGKARGKLKL